MPFSLRDIAALEYMILAKKRLKDQVALALELSGAKGWIPRFLTQKQIERIRQEQGLVSHETAAERAWRDHIEFCSQVQKRLYAVNRAVVRAAIKSERRVQEAREALEAIRRRATVDKGGRRVYRTQDRQRGFTDDGLELTREEVAAIHWDPSAPTWEERLRAGDRLRDAEDDHKEILRAQMRADYYSNRMESGDILSMHELNTIRAGLDDMPEAVRAEMPGRMEEAMRNPSPEPFHFPDPRPL